MNDMQTDIRGLSDGDCVMLYPNSENNLHVFPVKAIYSGGYFYCDGSNALDGPDYYFGDVLSYCHGWSVVK